MLLAASNRENRDLDTALPGRKIAETEPDKKAIPDQFMKPKLKRFQSRLVCAVALGTCSAFSLAAAAEDWADTAETSIPWSQIGAKAGAEYQGDGPAVSPTAAG